MGALAVIQWEYDPYDAPPPQMFPAATLLHALEAVDIDDPQWHAILDALARARQRPLWLDAQVAIRRYQPYG